MRREVALAGFALLGVLAFAGWTRKPANPQAAAYPAINYTQPAPAYGHAPAPYGAAPMMYVPGQPVAAQPMAVQPVPVQVLAAPQPVRTVVRQPAPAQRTVVQQQPVRTVQAKQPRSTGQSVAIVAGSSGVGAAVGALAGGKKGAAIGALAGGGGGFVYDRLTRNR
jgi:uncharacterized protein YcfJ